MSDETGYGLVMPFVVVAAAGGPYADDAYCAGYEAGLLDARLAGGGHLGTATVQASNVAQVDLVAMRHGWLTSVVDETDGWATVAFTRGG